MALQSHFDKRLKMSHPNKRSIDDNIILATEELIIKLFIPGIGTSTSSSIKEFDILLTIH